MTLIGFYEQAWSESSWESSNSALIAPNFKPETTVSVGSGDYYRVEFTEGQVLSFLDHHHIQNTTEINSY